MNPKLILLLFPFLVGCESLQKVGVSWELLGITSTRTHKQHVEEAQEFYQDGLQVQAKLVQATDGLNQENIISAKADNDEAKLERAFKNQVTIDMAKAQNEELTSRKFSMPPEPPFDFGGILQMLLAGATGAGGVGMIALKMRGTIKDLAKKAVANGNSTEVDDVEDIKRRHNV